VHYDARYEAEDVFHRFAKLFQIGLLVFIGAASGGWNPHAILTVDTLFKDKLPTSDYDLRKGNLHGGLHQRRSRG
jgi:hypothetical protein